MISGVTSDISANVYSGRDGKVLLTLRAENKDDAFGRHVSGIGDVNPTASTT